MSKLQEIMRQAVEAQVANAERELISRLGRKPLPDGESRDERTTIRWKPDEIALVKSVAGDASIAETIRELTLEAARARLAADR